MAQKNFPEPQVTPSGGGSQARPTQPREAPPTPTAAPVPQQTFVPDTLDFNMRAAAIQRYAKNEGLQLPPETVGRMVAANVTQDQFYGSLGEIDEKQKFNNFLTEWMAANEERKLAMWHSLRETDRRDYAAQGIKPPSENSFFRNLEKAGHWLRDDVVFGGLLKPLSDPIKAALHGADAALDATNRLFRGAIVENADDIGHDPNDYLDRRDAVDVGAVRVQGGMLAGIGETVGEIGKALVRVDRWDDFWDAGGENGEAVFFESQIGTVGAKYKLDETSLTLVKQIAALIPSGLTISTAASVPGQPMNPSELAFRNAAFEWVEQNVIGSSEEVLTKRQQIYTAIVTDDTARKAALELSQWRISVGRLAAIKTGYAPGTEEFGTVSGMNDAISTAIADPTNLAFMALKPIRAARWGIRTSSKIGDTAVAERVMKLGQRAPVRRVLEDVGRGLEESINLWLRRVSTGESLLDEAGQAASAIKGIENIPGVGEAFDRIARNHPAWTGVFDQMQHDVINALAKTSKKGAREQSALFEVVDGVTQLRPGLINDQDLVLRWMAQGEGLAALRRGEIGGHIYSARIMPHDSMFHLLAKVPKRQVALAIDWAADTPLRMARKLEARGLIDNADDVFRAHVRASSGTATVIRASRAVEGSLPEKLLATASVPHRSMLTMGGRFLASVTNSAASGPVNLYRGTGNALVRNYTSILSAEMRAKMANMYGSAGSAAERYQIIRGITGDMLNLAGADASDFGREVKRNIFALMDEGQGFANQNRLSKVSNATGTGSTHAAIGINDLSTQAHIPDMRKLMSIARRGPWLDEKFNTLTMQRAYQSAAMDWVMGRVWAPGVLFKLGFPLRASGDEVGLTILREGVRNIFGARMVLSAKQNRHIVPRFGRVVRTPMHQAMKLAARSDGHRGNLFHYDDWARALGMEDDVVERLSRFVKGEIDLADSPGLAGEIQSLKLAFKDMNPYTVAGVAIQRRGADWMKYLQAKGLGKLPLKVRTAIRKGELKIFENIPKARELLMAAKQLSVYSEDASRYIPNPEELLAASQGSAFRNPSLDLGESGHLKNPKYRSPDPNDLKADLHANGFKSVTTHGAGKDPRVLEAMQQQYERVASEPLMAPMFESIMEFGPQLDNGELTVEEFTEALYEKTLELMKGPEFREVRHAFLRSIQDSKGTPAIPDWLYEALENIPGSPYSRERAAAGASKRPKGPDGDAIGGIGAPPIRPSGDGAGGAAIKLGDEGDVSFHDARSALLKKYEDTLDDEATFLEQKIQEEVDDIILARGGTPGVDSLDEDEYEQISRRVMQDEYKESFADNPLGTLSARLKHLQEDATPDEVFRAVIDDLAHNTGVRPEQFVIDLLKDPAQRDHAWVAVFEPGRVDLETFLPPEFVDELFTRLKLLDPTSGRGTIASFFNTPESIGESLKRHIGEMLEERGGVSIDDLITQRADELRSTFGQAGRSFPMEGVDEIASLSYNDKLSTFSQLLSDSLGLLPDIGATGLWTPTTIPHLQFWKNFSTSFTRSHMPWATPGEAGNLMHQFEHGLGGPITEGIQAMAEYLPEFQAMIPLPVQQQYQRLWQAAFSDGVGEDLLAESTKLNEILGFDPRGFALTPMHMDLAAYGFLQRFGEEDLVAVLLGEPSLSEFRNILAERVGAWANLATDTSVTGLSHGLIDGRHAIQDAISSGDDALGLSDLGMDIFDFMEDFGNLNEDFLHKWAQAVWEDLVGPGLGDDPILVKQLDDIWDDLLSDEGFLATLEAEDAVQTLGVRGVDFIDGISQPIIDSFSEGLTQMTGEVSALSADISRIDDNDLFALRQYVTNFLQDSGEEFELDEVNAFFSKIQKEVEFSRITSPLIQEQTGKPNLLKQVEAQLEVMNADGAPGFMPAPASFDAVARYFDYLGGKVDELGDAATEAENLASHLFGNELRSPDADELETGIAELIGDRSEEIALPGFNGGGPNKPPGNAPPGAGGDAWRDGEAAHNAMKGSGAIRQSQALEDHARIVVERFKETALADSLYLGQQVENGSLELMKKASDEVFFVERDGVLQRIAPEDMKGIAFDEEIIAGPSSMPDGSPLPEDAIDTFDGFRIAKRPLTPTAVRSAADAVELALKQMRGAAEEAGLTGHNIPVFWDDFLDQAQEAHALRTHDEVVEQVKRTILGTGGPKSSLTARHAGEDAYEVVERMIEGGGVDPWAVNKTVGPEFLDRGYRRVNGLERDELIDGVTKTVSHGAPMASIEELDKIDPRLWPHSALIPDYKVVRRTAADAWMNFVNNGFDSLLPYIDYLAREPMILHYFNAGRNEALEFLRVERPDELFTIKFIEDFKGDIDTPREAKKYMAETWNKAKEKTEELAKQADRPKPTPTRILFRGPESRSPLAEGLIVDDHAKLMLEDSFGRELVERLIPNMVDKVRPLEMETISDYLFRVINRADHTARDIYTQSISYASNNIVKYTDNEALGSLFAMKFRNVFPFFWAEERFIKRLAQSAYHSPEAFRRAQLTYKGLESFGFFDKDENGEAIFVYPFGMQAHESLSAAMGLVFGKDGLRIPEMHRTTGRISQILPGMDASGRPLPGPAVSIPVRLISHMFPFLKPFRDGIIGERGSIDIDGGIMSDFALFLPPTVVRALQIGNSEERYYSQLFNVLAIMTANDMVPPETATDEDLQIFQDRLRNWTTILATEQAIYGFVGLASPKVDIPEAALHHEFREITAELGWEIGLPEFMARYPDADANLMFSTETLGGAPIPATEATHKYLTENEEFVRAYKHAIGYIMPTPDFSGEFFQPAWQAQMALELRRRRGHEKVDWLDSVMRDFYFNRAAKDYFESSEAHSEALLKAKGTPAAADIEHSWINWTAIHKEQHPIFHTELNSDDRKNRREAVLKQLRDAFEDPRLPRNSRVDKVQSMVESYDAYKKARLQYAGYSNRKEPKAQLAALRASFLGWGANLVEENKDDLLVLWNRVILPELEMNEDDVALILSEAEG